MTAAAAIVALVVVIVIALWRSAALARLGSHLAGDHRRAEAFSEHATSAQTVARVAELASLLASREEQRLIRWTPARAASGARLALGASPAAWYLWLPEPEILVRVPDAFVARVEHVGAKGSIVRLACSTRAADDAVTATDGELVEEAVGAEALAAALLDGLVIVDPTAQATEQPDAGAPDGAAEPDRARLSLGLAS